MTDDDRIDAVKAAIRGLVNRESPSLDSIAMAAIWALDQAEAKRTRMTQGAVDAETENARLNARVDHVERSLFRESEALLNLRKAYNHLSDEARDLRTERDRHRNANLVRAVVDGYDGITEDFITETVHHESFDRVPWMVASTQQLRAEKAEAALDAIEAMLTKKKRMGTLFDVQQIRAGYINVTPKAVDGPPFDA